jgi:tetrapyrrole methylase family protein/MazG family protein
MNSSVSFQAIFQVVIEHGLIDPTAVQVFAIEQVLQTVPVVPANRVLPWVEQQGLGSYQPPRLPFPLATHTTAFIWGSVAAFNGAALATLLGERYPLYHPLTIISLPTKTIHTCLLSELAVAPLPDGVMVGVIVPALSLTDDRRGFDRLRWVIIRLLGPDGCPWDVRQTHQSLRQHFLEEVYEAIEALDTGDMAALCEELGDVLLQVLVHSEMARQAGSFSLEDVVQRAADKLIFRHPHVFANTTVDQPEQVASNWHQLKAQEQAVRGKVRSSALDGVPMALPALAMAQAFTRKAINAGFTWQSIGQVWAKVEEELQELRVATDPAAQQAELGDLLIALVTLAYWLRIDAETALREANMRYKQRFQWVEQMAARSGRVLKDCSPTEMLSWWVEAKVMRDEQ